MHNIQFNHVAARVQMTDTILLWDIGIAKIEELCSVVSQGATFFNNTNVQFYKIISLQKICPSSTDIKIFFCLQDACPHLNLGLDHIKSEHYPESQHYPKSHHYPKSQHSPSPDHTSGTWSGAHQEGEYHYISQSHTCTPECPLLGVHYDLVDDRDSGIGHYEGPDGAVCCGAGWDHRPRTGGLQGDKLRGNGEVVNIILLMSRCETVF